MQAQPSLLQFGLRTKKKGAVRSLGKEFEQQCGKCSPLLGARCRHSKALPWSLHGGPAREVWPSIEDAG
jgi:hypothetical protein